MIQPYDEATWLAVLDGVEAIYVEANEPMNTHATIHALRAMHDYHAGMSLTGAVAKHYGLLRRQLGIEQPFPPPEGGLLPRLRVNGHVFETETGDPFTAIQCSDFNLLCRFQSGEDIRPILAQRVGCGFNMLRVWTLYNIPNIGYYLDIDYALTRAFLRLCATFRLYVEFTAYTSTERPEHWMNLVAAVRDEPNVLLELVNEGTLAVNEIDMSRYARPGGILASHGSGGSEGDPPWEPWDYCTYHTNGADEEQRKVGKQAFDLSEVAGVPVLTNETSRFPEVGMWVGADTLRRLTLAFDSAAGAALLCAGSCFHSVDGKTSALWSAETVDAALAWTKGVRSVPIFAQHEPYRRRDDLLTPALHRVYQRGASDTAIVRIRK